VPIALNNFTILHHIDMPINSEDIMFILSYNPKGNTKDGNKAFVLKMFCFKRDEVINLSKLSRTFGLFNLPEVNIISISQS